MLPQVWLKAFSQLAINLSSGWFGAVFILPGLTGDLQFLSLTVNMLCGSMSLVLYIKLEAMI